MELLAAPEELAQFSDPAEAPPPKFEEEEIDILAFELWQRANCESLENEYWLTEEEALRCHASCL